jgi:hypothetical protein
MTPGLGGPPGGSKERAGPQDRDQRGQGAAIVAAWAISGRLSVISQGFFGSFGRDVQPAENSRGGLSKPLETIGVW